MSTTENKLNETFKKVGEEYGIETSATFAAYRDFKIRWQRTYRWAEFQVTDYLENAPEEVLEGLARTIFEKIQGKEAGYSEPVVEWLTAPEFIDSKQPLFIKRNGKISFDEGEHKSLAAALERLKEKGLVEDDEKMKIFWSSPVPEKRAAWSSFLMKVITINRLLDSEDVPDEVLDAVLLKEITAINCDYTQSPKEKKEIIDEKMKLYPGSDRVSEWLKSHSIEA